MLIGEEGEAGLKMLSRIARFGWFPFSCPSGAYVPCTSALVGLLMIFLLSGCSLFRPYVNMPPLQANSGEPFPKLRLAVNDIEELRTNEVEYRRNEQVTIRTSLSLITFGAAAGAGIATLFDAHRDTVLGHGAAAAVSYTGGSLFVGPERSRLYNAANRALYCIANAGHGTVSAAETIGLQTSANGAYEKAKEQINYLLDPLKRSWTTAENVAAKANAEEAIAAYDLAKLNFAEFKGSDASLAQLIRAAGRNVIGTLNEELGKLEPSFDAVLNAARSVGPLATSFRTTPEKKEQPAAPRARPPSEASDQDRRQLEGLTRDLNEAATAINRTVRDASNALADLASTCALHVPKIEALASSQTEVQINKDQTLVIEITGGKLPLTSTWIGTQPGSEEVEALVVARRLVINGKSKLQTDKSYELRIRDSSAAPDHVTIKIQTPKT